MLSGLFFAPCTEQLSVPLGVPPRSPHSELPCNYAMSSSLCFHSRDVTCDKTEEIQILITSHSVRLCLVFLEPVSRACADSHVRLFSRRVQVNKPHTSFLLAVFAQTTRHGVAPHEKFGCIITVCLK